MKIVDKINLKKNRKAVGNTMALRARKIYGHCASEYCCNSFRQWKAKCEKKSLMADI